MTTGAKSITIACEGRDDAVEKIIETLRDQLKGAKGYALTFSINRSNGLMIGHSAGGELSVGDLGLLCVETLKFSQKISKQMAKCDCPAARARQTVH
ncbi:hypothetical protein NE637_08250 [Desulfovibrio desulfuricans]|uniref:hypothetical protein n=1 Tax=Desulfovibrio TaxID=872 RepID=UPI00210E050E|nr:MULTISPECIES: hypothetical protein [Desulfovibrio]MCQ4861138.1 hypothetical protein [Desulfovibrio desulfuricans]